MGKLERFYSQLERRIQASSTFVEPLTWEQLEYVVRHGRRLNHTPSLERLTTFIPPDLRTMALDPGQTTGFSYWVGNELEECGQQTISAIEDWLDSYADSKGMDQLMFENYRVYGSRMKVQGNALHAAPDRSNRVLVRPPWHLRSETDGGPRKTVLQ